MILLAAGGVALFALRRINRYVLTGLLAGVMLLDLVPVDLRFLSSENFVSPRRNQVTAARWAVTTGRSWPATRI